MNDIKYFEPLNLYKTYFGNVIATKAQPIVKLPEKTTDFIEPLKEMYQQFLINIKTGGPSKNFAKEFIELYPFSDEDRKYIIKEVFGKSRESIKESNEKFKTLINSLYFPLDSANLNKNKFITENPTPILWTDEKFKAFKVKHVFPHFIGKNFHHDLDDENAFQYEFEKKENETIESLKLVKVNETKIFPMFQKLVYNPKNLSSIGLPSATGWKWDNEDEYKRLGISGKILYVMKHKRSDVFWVPLVLDENTHTFRLGHYSSVKKQFDIYNKSNIIALVCIEYTDTEKKVVEAIDLFSSSYFSYILTMIDKTLNKSLLDLLATKQKTELDTFSRVMFP